MTEQKSSLEERVITAVKRVFASERRRSAEQGSVGGKKGRANMTPEERSEAARKAAEARWGKEKR
ncbi:MAG: RNA-binding protein [Planctomycetota bacterium]